MKKKFLIIFLFLIMFSIFNGYKYNNENIKNDMEINNDDRMLSMMLETEAGSGKYKETTASEWPTDGYIFNENLSKCENGGILTWDDTNKKVIMSGNTSDKCYVYFDIKNSLTLANYVISQYNGIQGNNNIYYHDTSLSDGAEDYSYRYAGSSDTTNNYVCFGSDEITCPEDNLYRIIGVFDGKVKLVKYTDIGQDDQNVYSISSFKDTNAYKLLNENFYMSIVNYYKQMIVTQNWIDGYIEPSNVKNVNVNNNNFTIKFLASGATNPESYEWYSANSWYKLESNASKNLNMKVGTISISELRYAMAKSNWNSENIDLKSWIVYKKNEAIYLLNDIGVDTQIEYHIYYLTTSGQLFSFNKASNSYYRPAFYLNSDVLYSQGTGTFSDPIRIE